MTTAPMQRLGLIYNSLGLNTSPELVTARSTSAAAILAGLQKAQLVPLVRAALRLAKPEELEFMATGLSGDDPAFNPASGDAEISAVASAMLWHLIDTAGQFRGLTALAVVTASFGGARSYIDPGLADHANATLASLQQSARPRPGNATYRKQPVTKEDFEGLETQGNNNNFQAAAPHLKKLITANLNYTMQGLQDLAGQLQGILNHQARLEEEMKIHWWLVGSWSRDQDKAFSDLPLPEAALLSGKELADLTFTEIGLSSAPGILDLLLQKGRKGNPKPLPLAEIVLATPLSTRADWTSELLAEAATASLTPLAFAAALAVDSNDDPDWRPRFQRLTAIDPNSSLLPLDAAIQFYREQLLLWQLRS